MAQKRVEDIFDKYISPTKAQAAKEGKPYHIDIEVTTICPHTCKFCFSSSDMNGHHMPSDKVIEVIDDLKRLGFKHIYWSGGEPLLHPQIWDLVSYAKKQGITSGIMTGGLPLGKKEAAKRVCDEYGKKNINVFGIHIDTINQEVFNQLHSNPREMEKRIQGYRNLLELGFPPERILPCITLTGPAAASIEETIDWYIDEMGARFVEMSVFKPQGRGYENRYLEPSLSDVRRAYEYRAQKLGSNNWVRIGSTECSTIQCRTNLYLGIDGRVKACSQFPPEWALGNIYQERLFDIYCNNREAITMKNLKIKGKCAQCENNDICAGCRGAAHRYLGDVEAADPKCWLNPEAKEYYCQ